MLNLPISDIMNEPFLKMKALYEAGDQPVRHFIRDTFVIFRINDNEE